MQEGSLGMKNEREIYSNADLLPLQLSTIICHAKNEKP